MAEYELKIDETRLDEELSEQASNYLWAATAAVRGEMEFERYKLKTDELYAAIDHAIRSAAEDDGRKITEKAIEGEINRNTEYRAAKQQLLKLRTEKEVMRARKEAWYMRKDALIQLAIKQRSELAMMGDTVKEVYGT